MQSLESQTFTRSDLVIRPAQPEDRAALVEIASQIWEGEDYLPRVLDDWYSDPSAGFYVLTVHDQVAGVAKLTRRGEGEWWLEGLRIAPAYQGHGLARILHHFVLEQLRQQGQGVIRFTTEASNQAVHTLARETGFQFVAAFAPYSAPPLAEPVEGLLPLAPADLDRLQAWLAASPHYEQVQRSLESEWCFEFVTPERLQGRLAAGLVHGWPSAGQHDPLGGVVILNGAGHERWPEDVETLKIAYLDAAPDQLAALSRDVRRLAASLGRTRVLLMALERPERLAALEQAGYQRDWEGGAHLFARDVVLTGQADVRTEELPPLDGPAQE